MEALNNINVIIGLVTGSKSIRCIRGRTTMKTGKLSFRTPFPFPFLIDRIDVYRFVLNITNLNLNNRTRTRDEVKIRGERNKLRTRLMENQRK